MESIPLDKSIAESKIDLMDSINDRVGEVFSVPQLGDDDPKAARGQPALNDLSNFLDRLDDYRESVGQEFDADDVPKTPSNINNLATLNEELTKTEFEAKHGFGLQLDLNENKGVADVILSKGDKEVVSIEVPFKYDLADLELDFDYDPDDAVAFKKPYLNQRTVQVETISLDNSDLKLPEKLNSDGIDQLLDVMSDKRFISEEDASFTKVNDDYTMTQDKMVTSTFLKDLEFDPAVIKDIAEDVDRLSRPELKQEVDHKQSIELSM